MSLLDVYRAAMLSQYQAALRTLIQCVELCPESMWDEPVANNPFCQSVFHALFFADLYLGPDIDNLRDQEFHRENPHIFRNYEEFENRPAKLLYDYEMIDQYIKFVSQKIPYVLDRETEASLAAPVGFEWLDITRAAMHPYNIRHMQHHAAQLVLKLRLEADADPRWFR